MSHKDKYNDLMLSIQEDEEKKEEQNRIDATLEQIREVLPLLRETLEGIKEARKSNAATVKGLYAAAESADNVISGISSAIVKAENTPIKAKLDDESIRQLQALHAQWIEQDNKRLSDHHKQQETLWQKQSQRLTDIVKNNEGVWISTKLFYIVGSLSLLSIITIVMEIVFYVYFHWIQ